MKKGKSLLRQIEQEVLAEGKEFMRKRTEEKLAELTRREGGLFPPHVDEIDSQTQNPAEDSDAERTD